MDKQSLAKLLIKTKPFNGLSMEEIQLIIHYGEVIEYQHHDVILTQGKIGSGLFVILNGMTSVTVKLLGQGDIKLANLLPGQFFGEVNLLENTACTATVRSIQDSKCFLLRTNVFNMLYIAFPKIRYKINTALIENVLIRQKKIISEIASLSKNSPRRIVRHLSHRAAQSSIKKTKLTATQKIKKLKYLNALPAFRSRVNHAEMRYLLRIANRIETSGNYPIIKKNDKRESYFIVLDGSIQASIPIASRSLKFTVIGPNAIICSTSVFDEKAALFTYETCGKATLLEISHDALISMKKSHPSLWYKIHDIGCRYIVSLQRRLNVQIVRMSSEIA